MHLTKVAGPKVFVLFHSRSGNTLSLASAIAEGALSVPGAHVELRRVPELTDEEVLIKHPYTGQAFANIRQIPVAAADDLADCDAIIMGSPSGFGVMSAEMKRFVDGLAKLWFAGKLRNTVGAAFTSASTPHGGHEMTLMGFLVSMMHLGMIVVTPGFIEDVNHIAGAPYGATATTKPNGEKRGPTDNDLKAANALGKRVASIAWALRHGSHAASVRG